MICLVQALTFPLFLLHFHQFVIAQLMKVRTNQRLYSWHLEITRNLRSLLLLDVEVDRKASVRHHHLCSCCKANLKSRQPKSPRRPSYQLIKCHVDALSIPPVSYKTHFPWSTVHHCLYNFSAATSTSSRSRRTPIGNYCFKIQSIGQLLAECTYLYSYLLLLNLFGGRSTLLSF